MKQIGQSKDYKSKKFLLKFYPNLSKLIISRWFNPELIFEICIEPYVSGGDPTLSYALCLTQRGISQVFNYSGYTLRSKSLNLTPSVSNKTTLIIGGVVGTVADHHTSKNYHFFQMSLASRTPTFNKKYHQARAEVCLV